MFRYAIIDNNNTVEHAIESKKEIPKKVFEAFFPGCYSVLENYVTGEVVLGGKYINNKFTDMKPFESWVLSGREWSAPVPYPENGTANAWHEESQQWISLENL